MKLFKGCSHGTIVITIYFSQLMDCIGGSKGGRQGRAPPPGGPNSFIFMQFLAKKLQNNSTFGSWRPLLGEILDPPLDCLGFSVVVAVTPCEHLH